ncbi:sugar phosphate isomerase/epimerase [Nocardioides albidus]|uniref:Sugar phosphate isomerase/epimerase n=1 Tax=Nocardioides albidus TaxID=1517589 RepID=A0A5C4WPN1_9ACTN|nr:sugar phosphate isomerase/epimerase family protein [Nocardioides albidus]TNM50207.1 sugar phosphate isomerase/epimerase [Nocardioides albidus]
MSALVGADVKLPSPHRALKGVVDAPWQQVLADTAAQGLDGVLLRTVYELSPTLDAGLLRDVADTAAGLGLYLELGVGKVNPYMTAELPEVRRLGDGSYVAGMERMIEAAAAIGCHELWTATGNFQSGLPGLHKNDRYRRDAPWSDQLAATERLLARLAPVLRACGSRLNLETHEEITTPDVVRLVEAVGPDVVGVTFDSANVYVHGETAEAAARRVAPYTRMCHLRDVVIVHGPEAPDRYLVPCGEGVVDWAEVLGSLLGANPDLHLTIEPAGPHQPAMQIWYDDPRWRVAHPDLDPLELDAVLDCVGAYEHHVRSFDRPDAARLRAGGLFTREEFLRRSAGHLRGVTAAGAHTHPTKEYIP